MSGNTNVPVQQVSGELIRRNYEAMHLAEQVGMPLTEAEALVQLFGGEPAKARASGTSMKQQG